MQALQRIEANILGKRIRKSSKKEKPKSPKPSKEEEVEETNEEIKEEEVKTPESMVDKIRAWYYRRFSPDVDPKRYAVASYNDLCRICLDYLRGLQFVMMYYYQGVASCSWSWFYPYHFPPLVAGMMLYEVIYLCRYSQLEV